MKLFALLLSAIVIPATVLAGVNSSSFTINKIFIVPSKAGSADYASQYIQVGATYNISCQVQPSQAIPAPFKFCFTSYASSSEKKVCENFSKNQTAPNVYQNIQAGSDFIPGHGRVTYSYALPSDFPGVVTLTCVGRLVSPPATQAL